jgi:site-specific DNA-methyltransferase (adenine-specific)
MEKIPCIVRRDLTPEQVRAYRVVDNKIAELSEWNEELLAAEISDLTEFNFADYGFDLAELAKATEEEPEAEDDGYETDTEKIEIRVHRGEVWKLGDHRLMCGDSTSGEDMARLMCGEKADMVFTDPPYGVAIGDKNKVLNSVQRAGRCLENIANDTLSEEELYEMLKSAFINVRNNCADDAVYYVTSPQGGSLGLMMMMMKDAGLPVRHVLMWRKNSPTFSLGRLDYDYQHEPIFYTWTDRHHNYRAGKYRTTVWDFDKPRKCDVHPTMKPVGLVENAILDGTERGMVVLDVFGGSGTTVIASERTGRKCRMMELDEKYATVILNRWEEETGKKGERIETAANSEEKK